MGKMSDLVQRLQIPASGNRSSQDHGEGACRGAAVSLRRAGRQAHARRRPTRRGPPAGAPHARRRRTGQGGMPRGAGRRHAGIDGAGLSLRPASASPQARIRARRRGLTRARYRCQHGDLQPHRCGAAPDVADRRSRRASASRAAAGERRRPRVRVPGVPSHSRRERRVHRRRSLRIRAAQCQRRWKRRTHIRWTAGIRQLLLAAGRARRRRPDHRSRRRPEPERASGRGHQPRLLEAAVRSRTVGGGPDAAPVGHGLSPSSVSLRKSSSGSRSDGRRTSGCPS